MRLIDKDALVAEIDRKLDKLYEFLPDAGKVEKGMITISEACNTGKYTALESFKDYIETLEVKEVNDEPECRIFPRPIECYSTCKECPFKAQKGEEV